MSLESEKKYSTSHEKLDPKVQIDTKSLLNQLAQKIASEYGIDVAEVKKLINSKTETKLETLKNLVATGKEVIDTQSLQAVIKGAKEVVEKASKEKIQILKGTVEKSEVTPQEEFLITTRLVSNSMYERARNPKNLSDNILWAGIGAINSVEVTIQMLYNIWVGALKTPYHIYLIVSWKAEYTNIRRI